MNQPLHNLREVAFATPSSTEETSASLAAAVEAHYDELRSFIAARVPCPNMAADIAQDLWLRVAAASPVDSAAACSRRGATARAGYRTGANGAVDLNDELDAWCQEVSDE